jgi:hypothetical protein
VNPKLVIRAEQMDAFRRQLTAGLARRLLTRLVLLYPEHTAAQSPSDLTTLIDAAITDARAYGIVSEDHLLHYLEFVLHYGPQFNDPQATPWASEILRQPNLTPAEKLRLLDGYELFGQGHPSA